MPVTIAVAEDINAWAIGAVHTFQRRMVSLITADQQGRIWVRPQAPLRRTIPRKSGSRLKSSTWQRFCSPATGRGKSVTGAGAPGRSSAPQPSLAPSVSLSDAGVGGLTMKVSAPKAAASSMRLWSARFVMKTTGSAR